MTMRLFITGASGNTGRAFLERLFRSPAAAGADVLCLRLPGDPRGDLSQYPVRVVEGDASDPDALCAVYDGPRSIVHISSIFHAAAVVEACRPASRIVAISSTGRFSRYRREAERIAAGERTVEESGIPWTILRPTMIYGTPYDRNVSKLVRLIDRRRFMPLPGGGRSRFRPVTFDDLAGALLSCLERDASIGKAYTISGGSAHTLREIASMTAELMGRRVSFVPVPLRAAILAVRALEAVGASTGVRPDQVLRLLEDKDFGHGEAAADLGFSPVPFAEGLRRQVEAMGLLRS
ncbi:MAG: NAD(P)H-binding protein [Candidatus Krumholzibacteria bacterium]|nr:NAD(P)H-binding protein [Candidatus Krumholzibacteria bacterium]